MNECKCCGQKVPARQRRFYICFKKNNYGLDMMRKYSIGNEHKIKEFDEVYITDFTTMTIEPVILVKKEDLILTTQDLLKGTV